LSRDRVRGLAEANALFNNLPAAAAHELADTIGRIARDVSAEQQAAVAKKTGHLRGGLVVQLLTERLQARVGLLGIAGGPRSKAVLGSRYYGRFVNFGRMAQTVLVTRRLKRRIKGNGRNGTKRRVIYEGASTRLRRRGPNKGTPIGSAYKMKVRAQEAREFVRLPKAEAVAVQQIADFWSRTLPAAGASA
jgi:hypothetical protein